MNVGKQAQGVEVLVVIPAFNAEKFIAEAYPGLFRNMYDHAVKLIAANNKIESILRRMLGRVRVDLTDRLLDAEFARYLAYCEEWLKAVRINTAERFFFRNTEV